jgi:hypothetical protein
MCRSQIGHTLFTIKQANMDKWANNCNNFLLKTCGDAWKTDCTRSSAG